MLEIEGLAGTRWRQLHDGLCRVLCYLDESLVKFDVCAQSGPLSSGFQGWPLQASQHWSDEHWGFDGNSVVPI